MSRLFWQASGDLWRRYRDVFRAAWAERDALVSPQRQAHEAAFLPAHLELMETPVHPAPRWTMRSHGSVTLGGAGALPVALGNAAPGALNVSSTAAVNGAQLFGLGSSVAPALGGDTAYSGGAWVSPTYSIQGNLYN